MPDRNLGTDSGMFAENISCRMSHVECHAALRHYQTTGVVGSGSIRRALRCGAIVAGKSWLRRLCQSDGGAGAAYTRWPGVWARSTRRCTGLYGGSRWHFLVGVTMATLIREYDSGATAPVSTPAVFRREL